MKLRASISFRNEDGYVSADRCEFIVSTRFINQGESTVKINNLLVLERGKEFEVKCRYPYFDATDYKIEFDSTGGKNNLIIVTQEAVK